LDRVTAAVAIPGRGRLTLPAASEIPQHERRPIGGLRPPVRAPHQVAPRLRPRAGLHRLQCRCHHQVRSDTSSRGATLAKRIINEVEVSLLIRAAPSKRDPVLLEVIYAGGLRVSETVSLTWPDVLSRDDRVQLSITGKVRQVLLPEIVSRSLLSLRGDAGDGDHLLRSRLGGGKLTERNVNAMVKRAAAKAGINEAVSPHWLRHAHGSHAIDRGASLPEVQTTLGHGNIATTSGYLHARPDTSSGLHLDPGVFPR
jgi:site-specific recombinase XerD